MFNKDLTLVEAIQSLRKDGFKSDFRFENGVMKSSVTGKHYQPKDMVIVKNHRLEGASNPSDLSVVFAVKTNQERGIIVSSYGTYADMKIVEFLNQVKVELEDEI